MGQHGTRAEAVAETMDTAGKAVLLSGATVLVSLSAVLLVPSPAFRSMAGGIMLSVVFVLAATLTLLPLVLVKLDAPDQQLALPWVAHRRAPLAAFAAWGERLWNRPIAFGPGLAGRAARPGRPVLGLKTAMPSIKVLPEDASARVATTRSRTPSATAPPACSRSSPPPTPRPPTGALAADPGIAAVMPAAARHRRPRPRADPGRPDGRPVRPRARRPPSTGCAPSCPASALVGGAAVENLDLKAQLDDSTPLVIGVVLALGFLLLLVALQAPLIALLGTLVSLLSTAAAFGVARLVFQEGYGAGLLGFEPQGFLDAWAPVFFFAMIFAIAMDYTVFLLASAKEHYERSGDPKEAMVGSLAHSGRVIFAAGAVMVAVFFTFALSGPLPPKEMGIVLGVAVLLDAFLVRLVLLPVMLRLTGRAAWWAPRWLTRLLPPITFSHG